MYAEYPTKRETLTWWHTGANGEDWTAKPPGVGSICARPGSYGP
jgi:hypothetical protein